MHVFLYGRPVGQRHLEGKRICEFCLDLPQPASQGVARGHGTQLSTVPAEEEPLMRAGQGERRKTKHMLPWEGSFQPPQDRWPPTAFGSRTVGAGGAAARRRAFPGHLPHPPPAFAQFLPTGGYSGSTRCRFASMIKQSVCVTDAPSPCVVKQDC